MTNRTLKWGEMLHLALMGIFGFTFGFWVDVPPKIAFFAPGLVFAQGVLLVVDSISDHNKLSLCLVLPVSNSKLCLGLSGLFSRDQYISIFRDQYILRMSHLRFHGIVYMPEQFWHTLYYNTVSTTIYNYVYPFSIWKSNSLTTRMTRQNVAK